MRYNMKDLVGRKARILHASIYEMVGKTVTILYSQGREDIIVGFPKESHLGWSHSDFLDYGCWFVEFSHLEFLNPYTKNKFR